MIFAPWDPAQVERLNAYQNSGQYPRYTCGIDASHAELVATSSGWQCVECDFRQSWARAADANWSPAGV